jgi:hypothetical protein
MDKTRFRAVVLVVASAGSAALAQDISTVNGYNVHLRDFNDFATSTLQWGHAGGPFTPAPVPATAPLPGFGAGVEFQEQFPQGTMGNFANRHFALFSNDGGATPFGVSQFQDFTVTTNVSVTSPAGSPRKEGGLKFFNNRYGGFIDEGEVLVAGDNGEVAAFGSNMLFFTFGAGTYTPGMTGQLTYKYFGPNSPVTGSPIAAYEVIFNDPVTGHHDSGIIGFDPTGAADPAHPGNGFNTGSTLGWLDQNQRNPTINDFADVIYSNATIVPTPGAIALLGLSGLCGLRRRR